MKTGTIEQTIIFDAIPQDVYELIMDEEKHAQFSGSEVEMSKEQGGRFSTYDGYCHGQNLELADGKKIVQHWHFEEEGWPEDHFSTCTFVFEAQGTQTKLTFTQTGIPEHKVTALESGWKEHYWQPMQEYLKK